MIRQRARKEASERDVDETSFLRPFLPESRLIDFHCSGGRCNNEVP